jgi:hypothetical protein
MKLFYITALVLPVLSLPAQQTPTHVSTGTTAIGVSAISVNTLIAKTYRFTYPFYNYEADSASGLVFFSARQKTDGGNLYLNKSYIGAVDMAKDSINWLVESGSYNLELSGNSFFFSGEEKTTRINKLHGFEDLRFPAKLVYALPALNKAFTYLNGSDSILSCISLVDAVASWQGKVPGDENWVDVKPAGDSLLLLAASGLHAINYQSGVLWSYPLATSRKITKATYSLANSNPAIRKISKVVKTSSDENSIFELSSNILTDNGVVYFAAKEKMIAVSMEGKLLWELDLKEFPVSKMLLYKKGGTLMLVNLGLAKYADNYVIYGSPFVLSVDPENGKVKSHSNLGGIENLVDFVITDKSLVFAGKTIVMEVKEGMEAAETLLTIDAGKYGNFAEFIDGSLYYTEKESFYVSMNFINDNLLYFRADNNKIYGIDKGALAYEYHLTDIYRLEKKFDNKLLIASEGKTLLVSSNFDLLATFYTDDKPFVKGNKIFFIGEQQIQSVDLNTLK